MHRSFLRLFPNVPPPCRDWFDFDFCDYAFYPPEPDPQEDVAFLSVNKLKTLCFYRQAPPLSYWYIFANDRKNRFAEDRTPWYIYRIPQRGLFFEIDDVYCGGDFIMVKIAEPEWPRWMVVWVHHHSMTHHSRYGRLFRRLKYSAWRASHRAASKSYSCIVAIAMVLGDTALPVATALPVFMERPSAINDGMRSRGADDEVRQ